MTMLSIYFKWMHCINFFSGL